MCDIFRTQHSFSRLPGCLAGGKARIRRSRADYGYTDAMLPHFFSQRLRKSDNTELRRTIYRTISRADFSGDRGNVDDVPSPAFDHGRKYEPGSKKDPS